MLNKVILILIQRGHEIMRCYEAKVQFVCCMCLLRSPKTVAARKTREHCSCRTSGVCCLDHMYSGSDLLAVDQTSHLLFQECLCTICYLYN